MSPSTPLPQATLESFPRVSGDEPFVICVRTAWTWFSPRERG